MSERAKPIGAEDLLSPDDLKLLSSEAARMFFVIWIRMDHKRLPKIHMRDADLSSRSRVLLPSVCKAREELVRAGLITAHCTNDGAFYQIVDA